MRQRRKAPPGDVPAAHCPRPGCRRAGRCRAGEGAPCAGVAAFHEDIVARLMRVCLAYVDGAAAARSAPSRRG